MAKKRFTDLGVEKLRNTTDERIEIPDANQPGLRLRVTPAGQKSWALLYRITGDGGETEAGHPRKGKLRRMTLGTFPMMEVEEARDAARDALKLASKGKDPTQKRQQEVKERHEVRKHTVRLAVADFIRLHVKLNNRRCRDTERIFEIHMTPRWGNRPVSEITRRDAKMLLNEIAADGKPYAATNVLKAARKMWNWLLELEDVEVNPFHKMKPPVAPVPRKRNLTPDEIPLVWNAADGLGYPFGSFVKLLLLTAARRNEIARARWSWIFELDGNNPHILIPADQYKSDRAHAIPLSTTAAEIIRNLPRVKGSDYVLSTSGKAPISGFSKTKRRLDKAIAAQLKKDGKPDIPQWRYHDLRRTAETTMAALRIPHEVRERVLGHAVSGLQRVYNQHDYLDEKREALQSLADRIDLLVNRADNVEVLRA